MYLTSVLIGVMLNKLYFVLEGETLVLWWCYETAEVSVLTSWISLSCSLIYSCAGPLVSLL